MLALARQKATRGRRRARAARGRHARACARRADGSRHLPVPRHAPPADARRAGRASCAASRRRSCRAGASPGTPSSFDPAIAAEIGGIWRDENGIRNRSTYDEAERRIDLELEGGATVPLWWVERDEWEAAIAEAGLEVEALYGWFDRRRSTPRARSSSGSRGSRERGALRPDRADLRPVVGLGHGGRRVLRRGGRRRGRAGRRAGGRHGTHRRPDRPRRRRGDRRRRVAGNARRRARVRGARGRVRPARPARRRPARAAGRGARPARHDPLPLAPPHAGRGREAPGAARRGRAARARRPPRLRRLHAERAGHRGDRRPLARARARHLRARRLGRARPEARPLRARATTRQRRWSSTGSRRRSGTR